MLNPFIDIQRKRELREWEQGEEKRRDRAEHERVQKLNQDFFRPAVSLAQNVGPVVFRILNQLKFALYGSDRDYWVTHQILAMDTVMKTDFTQTDPQSILPYPSNEAPDWSLWPIGEWEIVKLSPPKLADRRHPQGYHACLVSVSLIIDRDGMPYFSCRRSADREICAASEPELVRCLTRLCSFS